nr:hypothetical protein [Tanacetum cinerariifolium]
MDPNSSLEKICLGDDVVVISREKVEGSGDWNSPDYQDTAVGKGKKVVNTLSFYRMETDEISERYITPCFINGLEAYDGEVNLEFDENLLSNEYAIKLCLDYEKDKVELDGKTVKQEEDAVKRIKGEALKEKYDPGAFIFPIREEIKKIDKGITMIIILRRKLWENSLMFFVKWGVTTIITKFLILDIPIDHDALIVVGWGFLLTMGSILNTPDILFLTFDGVCHQTFRAARFDVLRTAESDSDDEEEYVIKRNRFGAPIYGSKPAPYLNCTNLEDRSSAIQTTSGTHDEESGSSRFKRPRQHETVEDVLLPQVHHEFLLWEGCSLDAKSIDLDTTTLRDLIDSDGKLIPEDPKPGVPRVGILRPPRASMIKEEKMQDELARRKKREDSEY